MLPLRDRLQLGSPKPRGFSTSEDIPQLKGFHAFTVEGSTCWLREITCELPVSAHLSSEIWPVVGQDEGLRGFSPLNAVYLDVETTGLYLGAGSFAFLIGLGEIREGRIHLAQLFLRDPRDERAALHYVQESLLEKPALVTYNGKSFDWPLIKDRFLMNRREPPSIKYHLDVLHPARRLWKHEFSSLGLKEVEGEILGVVRMDDIEGYLIPEAYTRFLRQGHTADIERVVRHNAEDIKSLIALSLHCARLYEDPVYCQREGELMAVARAFFKRGEYQRSCLFLEEVVQRKGLKQGEAMFILGLALKRLGEWDEALYWWEQSAQKLPLSTAPLVEMAKYYEHVSHDYVQAHALTYSALQIALSRREGRKEVEELVKRLRRLQGKIERCKG